MLLASRYFWKVLVLQVAPPLRTLEPIEMADLINKLSIQCSGIDVHYMNVQC